MARVIPVANSSRLVPDGVSGIGGVGSGSSGDCDDCPPACYDSGYDDGFAAGAAEPFEWTQFTQAMLDAGTKFTGSTDTLKSANVTAGRLQVVFNAVAGTADGFRETSGFAIPILSVLPTFDPDLHDIGIYFHDIQTTTTTTALAIALVTSPGSSAVGIGVLVTDANRAHPQTITTTVSASTFTGDAWCRFGVAGNDASATISSIVERVVVADRHFQASSSSTINTTDLTAVYLYIQAASYSGSQSDNSTADAVVYVAAIPRTHFPTLA